jgi:hypothetical protein
MNFEGGGALFSTFLFPQYFYESGANFAENGARLSVRDLRSCISPVLGAWRTREP